MNQTNQITLRNMKIENPLKFHIRGFWKQADLQVMVIPWLLVLVVFCYIPMYGLIMAFQEYRLGDVIGFSEWVGFKHFKALFQAEELLMVMKNTFGISLMRLVMAFPFPIILAIVLNEIRDGVFKRSVQTISYLPHFVSWVVVASLTYDILSIDGGAVNYFLQVLGFIDEPILFMGNPKYFWTILVVTDIWKEIGWNAIIYIAAISAIDPELYQAAEIDGAGRMRKIWHITLAGIKPTVVIMMILCVGGILNAGFEQVLLLTNNLRNTLLYTASEIIDTYVYRVGILQMRFSFATAAGIFKSLLSVTLLTLSNRAARKISDESLW